MKMKLNFLGGVLLKDLKVEQLTINYKVLEDFKPFQAHGEKELAMCKDLEEKISENVLQSPFYGIYYGNKLIGRMSLVENKGSLYLKKLEVLPQYRSKGIGEKLVNFAKEFERPIYTKGKLNSKDFWLKMNFKENDKWFVWFPDWFEKM